MLRAYRYRLKPDKKMQAGFQQDFGAVRFVHNKALEYRSKAYKRRGESKNYHDTRELLNTLKSNMPWLKDTYSQSLQMALMNLDTAFRNFFRDPGHCGYPRYWSKKGRQTLQYPQGCRVDFQRQMIYLPKRGWAPCIFHRRFKGRIKTVTVSLEPSGDYYVSVLVDDMVPGTERQFLPVRSEGDVLGVDAGVKNLAESSDGSVYANNRCLAKSEKRLKKEQRNLARKKKGSKNREKQRIKVAKINGKIANRRKDSIEKATKDIAGKSHAAVAIEDLNVKGMQKNHRLARAVGDASMSRFLSRLECKCTTAGKRVVKVSRWFASSQMCSCCGYVNKEVKDLSIREWECPGCHARHRRDRNASRNIAREGYRLIARLPMDGGEVTPVEKTALQEDVKNPPATGFVEAGRVLSLTTEAPCL